MPSMSFPFICFQSPFEIDSVLSTGLGFIKLISTKLGLCFTNSWTRTILRGRLLIIFSFISHLTSQEMERLDARMKAAKRSSVLSSCQIDLKAGYRLATGYWVPSFLKLIGKYQAHINLLHATRIPIHKIAISIGLAPYLSFSKIGFHNDLVVKYLALKCYLW